MPEVGERLTSIRNARSDARKIAQFVQRGCRRSVRDCPSGDPIPQMAFATTGTPFMLLPIKRLRVSSCHRVFPRGLVAMVGVPQRACGGSQRALTHRAGDQALT